MARVSPADTGPEAAQGIPDYLLKYHFPFPYAAIPGNSCHKICKPWKRSLTEQVNRSLPT